MNLTNQQKNEAKKTLILPMFVEKMASKKVSNKVFGSEYHLLHKGRVIFSPPKHIKTLCIERSSKVCADVSRRKK
jgi:hypothetical protein